MDFADGAFVTVAGHEGRCCTFTLQMKNTPHIAFFSAWHFETVGPFAARQDSTNHDSRYDVNGPS